MRKALQYSLPGARLFGTLHEPPVPLADSAFSRTGLLLLSFGQQPRSWVGDLGSVVADRVADIGFPVFRFDMPGLGDSPGELPVHLEVLYLEIQTGAHKTYLHDLCIKLQEEYALDGLVLGGFCGGAVTALFSADFLDINLKGLLLLEPEAGLTSITCGITGKNGKNGKNFLSVDGFLEIKGHIKYKLLSVRSWENVIHGKFDFRFWWVFFLNALQRMIRQLRGKKEFPPETNYDLLDCWKLARKRAIPTFVITVGTSSRQAYYRAFGFTPGKNDIATKLEWVEIPNTTHALLAGGAKESVCDNVVQWFLRMY